MNLVVAVDQNWAIGKDGSLLFHISEDFKHFRELTIGKWIVYGRKTLETFPDSKPLPGRNNIILTHDLNFKVDDADIVHNLDELRETISKYSSRVFVIGGASVYQQLLPYCDTAFVTKIMDTVQGADAFFPNLDLESQWEISEEGQVAQSGDLQYQFVVYHNKQPLEF